MPSKIPKPRHMKIRLPVPQKSGGYIAPKKGRGKRKGRQRADRWEEEEMTNGHRSVASMTDEELIEVATDSYTDYYIVGVFFPETLPNFLTAAAALEQRGYEVVDNKILNKLTIRRAAEPQKMVPVFSFWQDIPKKEVVA